MNFDKPLTYNDLSQIKEQCKRNVESSLYEKQFFQIKSLYGDRSQQKLIEYVSDYRREFLKPAEWLILKKSLLEMSDYQLVRFIFENYT